MRAMRLGLVTLAAAVAAITASPRATPTTLPETTYFYKITLTDTVLVIKPKHSVRPGSLIVFTVRNGASRPRNLVFGSYKVGFLRPGRSARFELNFLVPWSLKASSVERDGGHRLAARFLCSW
jgi:hypothetical protein